MKSLEGLPESFTVQCRTPQEFSEAQDILFKLGYRWMNPAEGKEKKEWVAWDGEGQSIEIYKKEMFWVLWQHRDKREWSIEELREAAAYYKTLTIGDKSIIFGPEGLSIDGALTYKELFQINVESYIYRRDNEGKY